MLSLLGELLFSEFQQLDITKNLEGAPQLPSHSHHNPTVVQYSNIHMCQVSIGVCRRVLYIYIYIVYITGKATVAS